MKSFDSRTYSINDFVEWNSQKKLVLNPAFQRRAVWNDKAKSYLIDTILRGKPIPKVFIRQNLDVSTKVSVREVVDGQQRLRTILSYVNDGFSLSRGHHPEYGGLSFSQLPGEAQAQFLSFEIAVDLLINLPDPEILDIFARLNSYAVVLNEQEKINAAYFGPFKVLADKIGFEFNKYWTQQEILTTQQILRMQEVHLVADLLIAMIEGIRPKKAIKRFYASYEREFPHDADLLESQFREVINTTALLFPEGLSDSEFRRIHIFYSLFTAVFHCLFGLPNLGGGHDLQGGQIVPTDRIMLATGAEIQRARNGLDTVTELFESKAGTAVARQQAQFLQDSRRATTDQPVRERRTVYLLNLMRAGLAE